MKNVRRVAVILLVPALAAFLSVAGCGGGEKKSERKAEAEAGSERASSGEKGGAGSGEKIAKSGEKEELKGTGWGTLKGTVTYDGAPPEVKTVEIPSSVKEKDDCMKGDTRVQTWKVGKDGGVANVVVWLRAPKGKYFEVPEDLRKADPSVVKLDQPHCSFIPHVMVLYPTYFDPKAKKQESTGQVLEVVNSAGFNHNTNWTPSDTLVNSGGNEMIQAHKGERKILVKADKNTKDVGGEQQLKFTCNIHSWMSAFARIFDHPYATVTSGDDKDATEHGKYEMKKVPAGVECELVYWHEALGGPKVLKKVTLKEGDNSEDFKIKQ
jgi:hypothetical protein